MHVSYSACHEYYAVFSIFQWPIHFVLGGHFAWTVILFSDTFRNMQCSQEHLKTIVYAKWPLKTVPAPVLWGIGKYQMQDICHV